MTASEVIIVVKVAATAEDRSIVAVVAVYL